MSEQKTSIQPAQTAATTKGDQRAGDIFKVPLSRIQVQEDFNHRTDNNYGDMDETIDNILANGQQTPVLGFKDGENWILTVGHRRIRAFHEIAARTGEEPFVLIRKGPKDPVGRLLAQYTENVSQQNTEYERAMIFQDLLNRGLTKKEVIQRLGLKPQYYARLIDLLNMPESVQESMKAGDITPNTAIGINRALKGQGEQLAAEVEKAVANAKAAGKTKATARHSEVSVTRTVQGIIKTTVKKLQEKVDNGKELTPSEFYTQELFSKILLKRSDDTIMTFIRKGE